MNDCTAQQPLSLDTTFRINLDHMVANNALLLPDEKVIVSGGVLFPGSLNPVGLARFHSDGSRDLTFDESGYGGGTLALWNDRFYAAGNTTVQRFMTDGQLDNSFIGMNSGPYFSSLQGGDYHVFPDGRLLVCGSHDLQDPARGYDGLYQLIWFSSTGYLDTTRTHRRCNGSTRQIEPLDNGQFLVTGIVSECEGQSVGRIFRINADGSLDPTLQTGVNWGGVYSLLPLDDGRFYASGVFRRAGFPNDTLRLVRFLPNGDLDPTFDNYIPFGLGELPGPFGAFPSPIQPWNNGSILVMGAFQFVDGEPRRGICVIDSTGQLMPEFDGCGVGLYVHQTHAGSTTYGSVAGYLQTSDNMAYIWGAYHGYEDGTINDTLQRSLTRLYGPDFTTGVSEVAEGTTFELFPNPANSTVEIRMPTALQGQLHLTVSDPSGRAVLQHSVSTTTATLNVGSLSEGIYLVVFDQGGQRLYTSRLAIQH